MKYKLCYKSIVYKNANAFKWRIEIERMQQKKTLIVYLQKSTNIYKQIARSSHSDVGRLLIAWRNSCWTTKQHQWERKKTSIAQFFFGFSFTEKRLKIITKRGAFVAAYTKTKWTNKSEHIIHGHFRAVIKIESLAQCLLFKMNKWFFAFTWNLPRKKNWSTLLETKSSLDNDFIAKKNFTLHLNYTMVWITAEHYWIHWTKYYSLIQESMYFSRKHTWKKK